MARIFICEHNDDVRGLFELFVRRLGHEPVVSDSTWGEEVLEADVVLVEPGSPRGERVLRTVQRASRLIPIVCASIYPPDEPSAPAEYAAYLLKPFSIDQLAQVLQTALQ